MKKLSCHCGEIQAEINAPDKLEKFMRCNCSLCKKKGAIMSVVKNEDFKIIKGKDKLSLYKFYTKTAKHFFALIVVFTRTITQELIQHLPLSMLDVLKKLIYLK